MCKTETDAELNFKTENRPSNLILKSILPEGYAALVSLYFFKDVVIKSGHYGAGVQYWQLEYW